MGLERSRRTQTTTSKEGLCPLWHYACRSPLLSSLPCLLPKSSHSSVLGDFFCFSSCCFRESVFCFALSTSVWSGSLLRLPKCLCHLAQRELSSHLLKCSSPISTHLLASLLCRSWIAQHTPESLLLEAQLRLQLQFSQSVAAQLLNHRCSRGMCCDSKISPLWKQSKNMVNLSE